MKIGLFFGSFNPIHIGHLILANTIAESAQLDKVWFVVSPQNPFKKKESLLHEFDRYDMVEKAIFDNTNLAACDAEFHLPKPSYTIDTLTYLYEKHPKYEFSILMGSDNLLNLKKWKNYEKVLEYHQIYVYPRPNKSVGASALEENFVLGELYAHPNVHITDAPLLEISATYLRERIQNEQSIRYLVPEILEEYIKRKKFYSK